jgi:hypothetical protein
MTATLRLQFYDRANFKQKNTAITLMMAANGSY